MENLKSVTSLLYSTTAFREAEKTYIAGDTKSDIKLEKLTRSETDRFKLFRTEILNPTEGKERQ